MARMTGLQTAGTTNVQEKLHSIDGQVNDPGVGAWGVRAWAS